MDNLAIELLEKISTFACSDGGRTGCSLSLTSKYIREATRATRFHSVSLTMSDPLQILSFSSHFHAERVALSGRTTPRIRHLRIASAEGASKLCKLVAPDLHTLLLMSGPTLPDIDVGGTDFPLLQELTILGTGLEFGALSPLPNLPNLTRLHIIPTYQKRILSAPDLRLWSRRAPGVTHLRVSLIDDDNVVLNAQLENIAAPELKGLPLMFPELKEVLVQPPPPGLSARTTPRRDWDRVMSQLGARPTRPLTIVKISREDFTGRAVVERQWSDRIAGGPGCWIQG